MCSSFEQFNLDECFGIQRMVQTGSFWIGKYPLKSDTQVNTLPTGYQVSENPVGKGLRLSLGTPFKN